MEKIKIIGISGSLRKGSFNTALLRAAKSFAPAECDIELVSIKEIPLYNYDDEVANGIPSVVESLKEKIVASDALFICTPEYNHSIPGVVKNALDWLTRPIEDVPRVFAQRKVGLIGASPSRLGTAFSQTAWLPVLRYLNMHAYFGNQMFVASAHTVFNEEGVLIDENVEKLLKGYMKGFCEFIEST